MLAPILTLSETEIAKLFYLNSRSEIGSEVEKMKFANGVNGLVVRFIRVDFNEELDAGHGTFVWNWLPAI
jgi:hypothetical protein